MSDDLERRLQEAFHRGSLPPAPASLVDGLQRASDAPVRVQPRRPGRTGYGLVAAAALIATLGALAITGGSRPGPVPITTTIPPSPSPGTTGLRLEYQVLPTGAAIPGATAMAGIVSILQARLAATGVVGATVEASQPDQIIITLPGVTDAEPVRKLIAQTGRVDFVPLGSTEATVGQTLDVGLFPPLFGAGQIASASVGTDQNGRPAIDFKLKPEGTRLFGDYTAQNIGSYFAITVDDVVITAPVIQNGIPNGDVQITGGGLDGFDATDASTIVAILNSGALPFPIQEVGSERTAPGPSGS
jgi:preprotein translocase subunit SecD